MKLRSCLVVALYLALPLATVVAKGPTYLRTRTLQDEPADVFADISNVDRPRRRPRNGNRRRKRRRRPGRQPPIVTEIPPVDPTEDVTPTTVALPTTAAGTTCPLEPVTMFTPFCQSDMDDALTSCDGIFDQEEDAAWCRDWLEAHNTRRCNFHHAHGLAPTFVRWDAGLAASAAQYAATLQAKQANGCAFAHDPSNTALGESLGGNSGSDPNTPSKTPDELLQGWFDDEYNLAECGAAPTNIGPHLGHFTQAAWHGTLSVGCAHFSNPDGTGRCHVNICRYHVKGNCNMGDWSDWKALTLEGSASCGN